MFQYTREEQQAMDKVAAEAAKKERENDPNVKDPKHTQDRMDEAVHDLRVRWGIDGQ